MTLQIAPEHAAIVHAILQKNVPDREVWAFGSRVKGTAKPFSDLDLAIIGDLLSLKIIDLWQIFSVQTVMSNLN